MFKKLIKSETVRRRISFLIFIVLVIPFGLFFSANWISGLGHRDAVGTLFGKPVPRQTFDEILQGMRRQWEAQMAGVPLEFLEPMLIQSAWDKLMLLEEARRERLHVSDLDLIEFIKQIPAFQENGQFARARYELILRGTGTSPRRFEELVRNDLLVQRLVDRVKAAASVPDDELEAAYREAREALSASLVVFDPAEFAGQAAAAVTDEAVRVRYEAKPEEMRHPEQVRIDYAGVSFEELRSKTQPTEEQLQAYYADHQDALDRQADSSPKPFEEVRDVVRERAVSELARTQLQTLALDLQDDLDEKKPFEDIVRSRALARRSAGPVDVDRAPALPDLPSPTILEGVKDLPVGAVSGVIETDIGVYVAQVAERIPSRVPPLEEVRDQVRARLVEERATQLAGDAARAFVTRLKDQQGKGLRFEEVLEIEQRVAIPARFTRTQSIVPIGYQPAVNEQAFATPLGQLTEVLETPGGFVLLRPEERIPADLARFGEERESVRQERLRAKQDTRFQEFLTGLRARAKLQSFLN